MDSDYTEKEKAKARKSGLSILRKVDELGSSARVLSLVLYWEPTHKEYRLGAHVPEGWEIPDVNALVSFTDWD